MVESIITEAPDNPVIVARQMMAAQGFYSPADVARFLTDHVSEHPDIDDIVDRETERAALLCQQMADDAAMEMFQLNRWGVTPRPQKKEGWVPQRQDKAPVHVRVQTYDEAWAQAHAEGWPQA